MITAVPKPPRREKKAKRLIKRSTKPIAKRGEAKVRKVKRQRTFYSSAKWRSLRKQILERANHRCEFDLRGFFCYDTTAPYRRCEETERLQVHHKTNVRFGGDEWLEDLQCLCKGHHDAIERLFHPTRHRR